VSLDGGSTLRLVSESGEWAEGTHVVFNFGSGSCVAGGGLVSLCFVDLPGWARVLVLVLRVPVHCCLRFITLASA
jgi:hypothetical protein